MDRKDGKPGAVILGGSHHSLGAARNLAKHDVPVCILDCGPCVSQFSKAVSCYIKCPPVDDEAEFIEFLVQIAENEGMDSWILFPGTDECVRILAQHRERLSEHYLYTIPSWEVVRFLYDKRLTYRLANEWDVPVPSTFTPHNVDELDSMSLEFPVVLKPAISKRFMAATKRKGFRANNQGELIEAYNTAAVIIDPSEILIQELIPGGSENLYSFVGFFKDGVTVSGLSARRPRQHPMEFGRASTYVEIVNMPELETLATQLLMGIEYSGLAEVEFMYDQKDERFELLEVNPRIWGWHTIAIRAGLDLPYLAYADVVGKEVDVGLAREGVKWVRLMTDTPTALLEILTGRLTVRQYLLSMSGEKEFAVLSFSDPLPFITDLFLAPYNYLNGKGF